MWTDKIQRFQSQSKMMQRLCSPCLQSLRLPSLRPVCGQCLWGQHLWGWCLCGKILWGRHPLGLPLCGWHLQTGVFVAGVFAGCVFAAGIFVVKILAAKIPATKTPASKSLAVKTLAAKTKYDDIKIVSSFWTVIGIKTSRFVKNDQIYWKEIFTALTLLKYIENSDDWFSWYNNQLVISKIFRHPSNAGASKSLILWREED